MTAERASFAAVRTAAKDQGLLAAFDAAHDRFGRLLGDAVPFAGGLAWMTHDRRPKPIVKISLASKGTSAAVALALHVPRLLQRLSLEDLTSYEARLERSEGYVGRDAGRWITSRSHSVVKSQTSYALWRVSPCAQRRTGERKSSWQRARRTTFPTRAQVGSGDGDRARQPKEPMGRSGRYRGLCEDG